MSGLIERGPECTECFGAREVADPQAYPERKPCPECSEGNWFKSYWLRTRDEAAARITALEAENERMREREKRNLSDTCRLIWRDEVEGICPSLDMCFEYGDHVRCGPCAIKASLVLGVEPNLALPALPEVSRLKRENERMKAALERIAERDTDGLESYTPQAMIQIARQALGGHHDAD